MNSKLLQFISLILITIVPNHGFCLQIKNMHGDGEAESIISLNDLTRIKVIDDRIKSIKTNQGEIEVLEDHQLGEIYIKPSKHTATPINIFLITEKNRTYKMLMMPEKRPSEQVFIKHIEMVTEPKVEAMNTNEFKQKVIQLINEMKNSIKTDEFENSLTSEEIIINGNKYWQRASIEVDGIVGKHLEFLNSSDNNFTLKYEDFNTEDFDKTIAISIDDKELRPGDKTSIFLVRNK